MLRRTLLLCGLAVVMASRATGAAGDVMSSYVSLGDSLAFGFSDSFAPSNGDRGYVSLYADSLAARYGGRPHVVSLGVYGETSSSLFTGVDSLSPTPSNQLNTNYTTLISQNARFLQAIQAEQAAGRSIDNVSISLGSNDLFKLATSPSFALATPAEQQAMLGQTLGQFANNYGMLLTEIKTLAPRANLLLIGPYNPFPAAPQSPFAPFAAPAIQALNQVIQGEAQAFGAGYVDTFSAFQGHEASYTRILEPPPGTYNVHPNDLGYAAIAGQMQTVPEPSSLILSGLGLGGLAVLRWSRWRRNAA